MREDSYRYALAFAYACQTALGVKAEDSYRLAAAVFLSKEAVYPPESVNMVSDELRGNFEKIGGVLVSYKLIHRGRKFEGRNQATNTLRKKANRYVTEVDAHYLKSAAKMFLLSLFGKGNIEKRANIIRDLSILISEEHMAAALIETMRVTVEDAAA